MKYLSSLIFLFILTITNTAVASSNTIEDQLSLLDIPQSLLYMDGRVTAMHKVSIPKEFDLGYWQAFDCKTKKPWFLYEDIYKNGVFRGRLYPQNSQNEYHSAELEAKNSFTSKKLELLKDVCTYFPKTESSWIVLKHLKTDSQETDHTLLLDINNSRRLKQGFIKLRLAYDYDAIQYTPLYQAPYSIKIEDKIINCEKQKQSFMTDFYIDTEGFVSDHQFYDEKEFTPLNDSAEKEVFSGLCAISDFTVQGPSTPITYKEKPTSQKKPYLPDFANNRSGLLERYRIPENVKHKIEDLLRANSLTAKFKHLTFSQAISGPMKITIDVDEQGRTRTLENYPPLGTSLPTQQQYIGIANFFFLKRGANTLHSPMVAQAMHTNIQFPFKKGNSFTVTTLFQGAVVKRIKIQTQLTCQIGQYLPANTIHANFPGQYWQIQCLEKLNEPMTNKKTSHTSNYAYLEDLGIFIQLGVTEAGKYRLWPISEVNLER